MWSCRVKLDEEKSKHACLAQGNHFGSAYLQSLRYTTTFLLLANFSQIPTCVTPRQPQSLKKSWQFEIICRIAQKLLKKFARPPVTKRHLLSSCGPYLSCVCACSLFYRVRVCQILLSLGRRSQFFLSSLSLLSLHLLTSFGDEGVLNIADVHSWLAKSVYCFLHAIASKLLLCIQV
jgi:hypothetical protein